MKNQVGKVFGAWSVFVMVSAMWVAPIKGQQATPGFSMWASPSSQAIVPLGPTAKYTVGFASIGGFAGSVAVGCRANSPHVVCSVAPASVPVNRELAAAVTVMAGADSNAKGTYSLTVTGTSGPIKNSTVLQLIVY